MNPNKLYFPLVTRSKITKEQRTNQYSNPYIKSGYRYKYNFRQSLFSILRLHNETINIWSHLVCFFLAIAFYIKEFANNTSVLSLSFTDKLIFSIYLFGCLMCFANSTILHLFDCGSLELSKLLLKLDFTGISTMILSSFLPPLYFVFNKNDLLRNSYMIVILVLVLLLIFFTWFQQSFFVNTRWARTLFYSVVVASGLIPTFHALFVVPSPLCWVLFAYIMSMFVSYLLGVICYAFYIPERWIRWDKLDYYFHSHQWWHFFVATAAYIHFKMILKSIDYYLYSQI
ncbi:adiponectin receptor protein [Anaeramoeba flamelloides]|uniref:Adiponectin receptor protein n=1 Tax=Anaeramoeba flamelloides TaxID=1746091 RepID=A0AAV7ZQ58_9EUKA|nr:adiponectin receptor protein [Anaeramoeba flamelloides]KAJ6233007.1 adiponectin receptor protein [Anaeramoeba flamelloides]